MQPPPASESRGLAQRRGGGPRRHDIRPRRNDDGRHRLHSGRFGRDGARHRLHGSRNSRYGAGLQSSQAIIAETEFTSPSAEVAAELTSAAAGTATGHPGAVAGLIFASAHNSAATNIGVVTAMSARMWHYSGFLQRRTASELNLDSTLVSVSVATGIVCAAGRGGGTSVNQGATVVESNRGLVHTMPAEAWVRSELVVVAIQWLLARRS